MRCRTIILLFVLVACGGAQRDRERAQPAPDAGPPPVDRAAMAEIVDGVLEVLVAMAEVVEARVGDCDAIATDLALVFEQAETIVAVLREADQDPAQHAVLLEEMDARAAQTAGLADRIAVGLAPCQGNARLIEVMQRMPTF